MFHTPFPFDFKADKSLDNPKIVLNLRLEDANRYQLVYASQLYGTFFSVFAKLTIKNDTLKTIQLSLVNYKGQVNLGLLPDTSGTWGPGEEGLEFTLHLKGNAGKHQYNDKEEIIVDCKNTPISDLDDGLVVRRLLLPMYEQSADLTKQLSKGIFDTEFFQRDGAFVTNRYHLDDLYKTFKARNIGEPSMQLRIEGVCTTAYVTIT